MWTSCVSPDFQGVMFPNSSAWGPVKSMFHRLSLGPSVCKNTHSSTKAATTQNYMKILLMHLSVLTWMYGGTGIRPSGPASELYMLNVPLCSAVAHTSTQVCKGSCTCGPIPAPHLFRIWITYELWERGTIQSKETERQVYPPCVFISAQTNVWTGFPSQCNWEQLGWFTAIARIPSKTDKENKHQIFLSGQVLRRSWQMEKSSRKSVSSLRQAVQFQTNSWLCVFPLVPTR